MMGKNDRHYKKHIFLTVAVINPYKNCKIQVKMQKRLQKNKKSICFLWRNKCKKVVIY